MERTGFMYGLYRVRASIIILIFLFLAAIVAISCGGDNDNDSATFNYPANYSGTYWVVFDWLTADSSKAQANATFEFKADGVFYMRVDENSNVGAFDICSVEGTYAFLGDSIILAITKDNLDQRTCRTDGKPEGVFKHTVDGKYLVFEHRSPDPYRRFELLGK